MIRLIIQLALFFLVPILLSVFAVNIDSEYKWAFKDIIYYISVVNMLLINFIIRKIDENITKRKFKETTNRNNRT
jgi:hypothetical protein